MNLKEYLKEKRNTGVINCGEADLKNMGLDDLYGQEINIRDFEIGLKDTFQIIDIMSPKDSSSIRYIGLMNHNLGGILEERRDSVKVHDLYGKGDFSQLEIIAEANVIEGFNPPAYMGRFRKPMLH